ncbi:MAG TPA: hypothetical protein EYP10_10830, partial [Armatimonadetes bacterium]|nr:hypothetical protein [Armatimonadota bacterium]
LVGDIAVVIPYLGIFVRDHWYELTELPWWCQLFMSEVQAHQFIAQFREKVPIDWINLLPIQPDDWWREHRITVVDDGCILLTNIRTGNERAFQRPCVGGEARIPADTGISSREEIDRIIPDGISDTQGELIRYRIDAIRRIAPDIAIVSGISAPTWTVYNILGIERTLMAFIAEPQLITSIAERRLRYTCQLAEVLISAGIDVIWLEDCLTSRDMISLEHFRRFVVPFVKSLIAHIRALDGRVVYYFCGDVSDRLDDLIAMQPSALAFEEGKKTFTIDIGEVAERVAGRCCIFGNLDAINVLEMGDDALLQREVESQVRIGMQHYRFVMSLGSPVTPKTSISRVRQYVELSRKVAQQ